MKKLIYIFFIVALVCGCGGNSKKGIPKTSVSINRFFEDLTLGMSKDDFKSKLAYNSVEKEKGELYESYTVYSTWDNALNRSYGKEQRMKEIENVYDVICSFFENKLYMILISYRNSYQPDWDTFMHNAEQKYGKGTKAGGYIFWNDGKTTLTIGKFYGKQGFEYDTNYGEHYTVHLTDNELSLEIDKKEKEVAPNF